MNNVKNKKKQKKGQKVQKKCQKTTFIHFFIIGSLKKKLTKIRVFDYLSKQYP